MPVFERTKMCAECPFRKNAAPGWLGPWTIAQLEEMIQFDHDFICHMDVRRLENEGLEKDEVDEQGQHCVGMLRYTNGLCKLSRDAEKAEAQRALRKVEDQPTIEPRKFREHHESLLGKVDKRK